jgi:hypothetical protein
VVITLSAANPLHSNWLGHLSQGDQRRWPPATLTFDNGTVFNDYFQGFTFGSTISFKVNLFGPALSSPDGVSTSGSTFAFSMFSDAAGTVPALTTDTTNGFAFKADVNLDGTTTVTNSSSQTNVSPLTVGAWSGFGFFGGVSFSATSGSIQLIRQNTLPSWRWAGRASSGRWWRRRRGRGLPAPGESAHSDRGRGKRGRAGTGV